MQYYKWIVLDDELDETGSSMVLYETGSEMYQIQSHVWQWPLKVE